MSGAAAFVGSRRVRLDEVDAAGIVYFARLLSWCHDALDEMLAPLPGGYAALVTVRRLGMPAVHMEADFTSPLRFGDAAEVRATVERLGTSSCTMRFEIRRIAPGAGPAAVATVCQVVALSDLSTMRARPFPDDLRTLLERYRVTP